MTQTPDEIAFTHTSKNTIVYVESNGEMPKKQKPSKTPSTLKNVVAGKRGK